MNSEIRIKWLKGEAKGSVDVLPANSFRTVAARTVFAHVVKFAGGGSDFAKVTAKVQPTSALLNYSVHSKFNLARAMTLGRLELDFTDETRTTLKFVAWDGKRLRADVVRFGTVPIGGPVPSHLRADGSPLKKGPGFGRPEQNALVERAAVKAVRAQLVAKGWTVRSVESEKCGYDLECISGTSSLHAEVKGIRGIDLSFIMTAGERKCASEDPRFQLFVVTSALAKPAIHRYKGAELEQRFAFTPLQWRLDRM
jgi:hypothetical protein